ncbi:protein kinase domain containing protein [Entamoeba histolytica KU27]|uniref:Protein kinase domain containing protein n=1 Tax=Entamoeba histolytica KU27 TaxID=885311 RepID=M2RSI2_ENTHI|nr:protein kinase domain containing protein [Entamoeba histolytica KU27]
MNSELLPHYELSNFFDFVENAFYEDEDFMIKCHRVLTKMKTERLFIEVEIDNEYEQLSSLVPFLLSKSLRSKTGILRIEKAFFCENNQRQCLWIILEPISPLTVSDYINKQELKPDEMKFMAFDFLKIVKDLDDIKIPCVVDERTLRIKRDPACPFPRVVLSPLAFILGVLYLSNGDEDLIPNYKESIATIISPLIQLPLSNDFIESFKENKSSTEISQLPFSKECIDFVNGPVCLLSKYTAESILGNGSYGIVMKAHDADGKIVAIKESGKENVSTLQREAIIMRLCNHPNIVKFLSYTVAQDSFAFRLNAPNLKLDFPRAFLVMELCDGGDLDTFLSEYAAQHHDYLPLDLVSNLFKQIAASQHYLHFEKGFIHRDIKLENFLLVKHEPYPIVKIADFGFGRAIADVMATFKGTPLFTSPQIIRKQPYTSKTDLYSIGVCLYRLTTCQYPFSTTKKEFYSQMKERKEVEFPLRFREDTRYTELIDLVKKLMCYDEDKRISWEDFYKHPYMNHI